MLRSSRGTNSSFQSNMLGRGYGLVLPCGDFFPDHKDGRGTSILESLRGTMGRNIPDDEPGAIGTWAGLSSS